MTEYAYSRKLVCISEETSMSTIRSVKSSSGGVGGGRRAIGSARLLVLGLVTGRGHGRAPPIVPGRADGRRSARGRADLAGLLGCQCRGVDRRTEGVPAPGAVACEPKPRRTARGPTGRRGGLPLLPRDAERTPIRRPAALG